MRSQDGGPATATRGGGVRGRDASQVRRVGRCEAGRAARAQRRLRRGQALLHVSPALRRARAARQCARGRLPRARPRGRRSSSWLVLDTRRYDLVHLSGHCFHIVDYDEFSVGTLHWVYSTIITVQFTVITCVFNIFKQRMKVDYSLYSVYTL